MKYKEAKPEEMVVNVEIPLTETTEEQPVENEVLKAMSNVLKEIGIQKHAHALCKKTTCRLINVSKPIIEFLYINDINDFKFPEIPATELVELDMKEIKSSFQKLAGEINDAIVVAVKNDDYIAVQYLQAALFEVLEGVKELKKNE